jgi:RimJ/RimL family protein N-acetyltransferase
MDWGQGLASEGASALVDWGFNSGLYDKIFASTMAVNLGSRRVMEKIGMTYLRTAYDEWPVPIPGSEQGEVKYEVMRMSEPALKMQANQTVEPQ